MKVEHESPLKKALSKGCLWMDEGGASPDGEQVEASQQLTASTKSFPMEENRVTSLFT